MSGGPTSIELYLVRHAVAAERSSEFPDDAARPLTAEGIERFRQAAIGLREFGVVLDLVMTSSLTRARETSDLLATALKPKPRVVVVEALAPGHKPAQVMTAVQHQARGGRGTSRIALVGHEPDLGELAARLLGAKGRVEFKKGAVCRIDLDRAMPSGPGTLRWLLPPRALRNLAS